MKKIINFAIREMWEVYAIDNIIKGLDESNIDWIIHSVPYNTDLLLYNSKNILEKNNNVSVIQGLDNWNKIFGFSSDISEKCKDKVIPIIDIQEVSASVDYDNKIWPLDESYDLIVSNVKINDKDKNREHYPEMWNMLWDLPYTVWVIPRHPINDEYMEKFAVIPDNITIINKMWVLRDLCARSKLVIMWLIFSHQFWETDHNPLEATINSHAIYWKYLKYSRVYKRLYNESWLMHWYPDFKECIKDIPHLINDADLENKLAWRRKWINMNRTKVLKNFKNIIL